MDNPRAVLQVLKGICEAEPKSSNLKKIANGDIIGACWKEGFTSLQQFPEMKAEFDGWERLHSMHSESTSTGKGAYTSDIRIRCGSLILYLYETLYKWLNLHEDYELSLGYLSTIRKSFQVAALVCVAPYLDDGVGIPIYQRSKFLKKWSPLPANPSFRCRQLLCVFDILMSTCACRKEIKDAILAKHVCDIICCAEQLINFGEDSIIPRYEAFLNMLSHRVLVGELLMQCKRREKECIWYYKSLAGRLSTMLSKKEGLTDFLWASYDLSGGSSSFLSHTPFLRATAIHLTNVPKNNSATAYRQCILDQFFILIMDADKHPGLQWANRVFPLFIDELHARVPIFCRRMVVDRLLSPWTFLHKGRIICKIAMMSSLPIIAVLGSNEYCFPKAFQASTELAKVCSIWLELLKSPLLIDAIEKKEKWAEKMDKELRECIELSLQTANKKEALLLLHITYCTKSPFYRWILKKDETKRDNRIQVVGEDEDPPLAYDGNYADYETTEDVGSVVRARTENFIDYFQGESRLFTVIDVLSSSLKEWMLSRKDNLRFVDMGNKTEESRLYWHQVAEVAFSYLSYINMEDFQPSLVPRLLKLLNVIMDWVCEAIADEVDRQSQLEHVDIVKKPTMEEQEALTCSYRITLASSKVAAQIIEVAAPLLILTQDPEADKKMMELSHEASRVYNHWKKLKNIPEEWQKMKEVASKLGEFSSRGAIEKKEEKGETVELPAGYFDVSELIETMKEGLPYEKGAALVTISRFLSKKDERMVKEVMEGELYTKIMACVTDDDSFVYLAAINALAESALRCTQKIPELVNLFCDMQVVEEVKYGENAGTKIVNQMKVQLRAKIGETIAKVFAALGSTAPMFLKSSLDSMLSVLKDEEEIMRASTLSAIAILLRETKGRGIDEHAMELVGTISSVVTLDKSIMVRRAGTNVMTELLKGVGHELIKQLDGPILRDLNRLMNEILKVEQDEVVRTHAQLAKEEMRVAMNEALMREDEGRIRNIHI